MDLRNLSYAEVASGLRPICVESKVTKGAKESTFSKKSATIPEAIALPKFIPSTVVEAPPNLIIPSDFAQRQKAYQKNTKAFNYKFAIGVLKEVRKLNQDIGDIYDDYMNGNHLIIDPSCNIKKAEQLCDKILKSAIVLRGKPSDYVNNQSTTKRVLCYDYFDGEVPSFAVSAKKIAEKGLEVLKQLNTDQAKKNYAEFIDELFKLEGQPIAKYS